jgi:hypothetical protein
MNVTVTTFVAAAGAAVADALNGELNVTAAADATPVTLIIIIVPATGIPVGVILDADARAVHVYNVPGFVRKLNDVPPLPVAVNVPIELGAKTTLPAV